MVELSSGSSRLSAPLRPRLRAAGGLDDPSGQPALAHARWPETLANRSRDALEIPMKRADIDATPMTVREAARFLGVSMQTVYLWVERKQIPHLRVMGRNIRFLRSDLEPFRTSFKREVEDGKTA
jgi:excisionase family DNA binding protein